MTMDEAAMGEAKEHGIDGAAYVLIGPNGCEPRMFCLCGFTAKGETWGEVGADLDAHLEESGDGA